MILSLNLKLVSCYLGLIKYISLLSLFQIYKAREIVSFFNDTLNVTYVRRTPLNIQTLFLKYM